MSAPSPPGGDSLTPSLAERLDPICDRFEAAWAAGRRPRIEDQLNEAVERDRPPLVRELIQMEVHHRHRAGDNPRPADYRDRFPELDPEWLAAAVAALPTPTLSTPAVPTDAAAACRGSPPGGAARWPTVAGYEILGELGRGGMGVVYKARQVKLNRVVALKMILSGEHAGPEALSRFRHEAEAVAQFQHPHIVQIYEVGEWRVSPASVPLPWFSLEYVDGGSLAQQLDGTPVPATEAAGLVETLARAVQHAHERGILHRDLKPANILLQSIAAINTRTLKQAGSADEGSATAFPSSFRDFSCFSWPCVPKITDFGLAKRLGDGPGGNAAGGQTRSGAILGTPSYMAPEQAGGATRLLGPSADVYALGAVLYELLTGRPPFQGESVLETLAQVQANEPVPPTQLRPRLPRDLETLCLKCLEKEPSRRYGSAAALADDLRRFLSGEPIHARPMRVWERSWRWCCRNPSLAISTTAAALLLVTVAVVASLSAWSLRAEQQATQAQLRQTQEAERKGKHQLLEAKLAQAQARRWSRQVGHRFVSWKTLSEAADLARELGLGEELFRDVRSEAIASLALADIRLVKNWEGWPAGSSAGLAFDAGLERYARSDPKGNLSVRRVADDRELAQLPGEGRGGIGFGAQVIKFSPDGALLAVQYWDQLPGQPSNFRLWDWQRGTSVFQPSAPIAGFDWSPDGRSLALIDSRALTLHEVETGKEPRRMVLDFPASHVAFHPDGQKVAVAGFQDGAVHIWNVATGSRLYQLSGPGPVHALGWHPNGVLLAVAYQGAPLYLWDPLTKQQHIVLQGHQNTVTGVTFAPDGDLLLSAAWDGTSRLWDPWTGRELLRFPGDARHFSRDGRQLIIHAGSSLAVWEVAPGREYRSLPRSLAGSQEGIREGGFSPDGRWLAVATTQGVRLWDLALGKEGALLSTSAAWDAKFHPSGQALFTSGSAGLYRWPWQTQPGTLRIGPAHQLPVPVPVPLQRIGLDRMGRLLAVVYGQKPGGGYLLDLEDPAGKVLPLSHELAVFVAVSPDSCWVATGTHHGFGVNVWEASSGQLAFPKPLIPDKRWATVAFSPDGRWLVTATDTAFALWEVGTWQRAWQLHRDQAAEVAGSMAFSPDGKILALASSLSVVQLINPETGHLYAQLEATDSESVRLVGFSPDGGQLVVVSAKEQYMRVWDLRQVRAQLKQLGLDWNLPPYPPAANQDARPLEVTVLGKLGALRK